MFQSTPARGGRPSVAQSVRDADVFQSTPARGGRRRLAPDRQRTCFNPRPRAAGDRRGVAVSMSITTFQSTPARGGRRCCGFSDRCQLHVSIHARARGATIDSRDAAAQLVSFNPRPRAAGDLVDAVAPASACVSIHARARRATCRSTCCRSMTMFQSTPARGGRHVLVASSMCRQMFQSTPARGGRRRRWRVDVAG